MKNLDKLIRVDILDKYITPDEISKQLQNMPNKKACSFDGILNEMIKCSKEIMLTVLTKTFNHLLHCEIFPRI